MRTLVGAADPGPAMPELRVTFTSTSNSSGGWTLVDEVHVWSATPPPPAPYRTTAHVGEPVREIEP